MTSENSAQKKDQSHFLAEAYYLGMALGGFQSPPVEDYVDLEEFFLSGTYNLSSSRVAEGFLSWLVSYGHLLSPSKVRRLILKGTPYDPAILGGVVNFLSQHHPHSRQWAIIQPYLKKSPKPRLLVDGPKPKNPDPAFLKFNIICHPYRLDKDKFLRPIKTTYKSCPELKNRALFGSKVHADVASYLNRNPEATPYQTAKATHNHKARVFEIFKDIQIAI